MDKSEIRKLERIAEDTRNEKESKQAMLKLRNVNPTYHWCAEWDYAVICDNHQEWDSCLCDLPDDEGRLQKIPVYGTKGGKLYIKPEELFRLPKVKDLIRKIVEKKNMTYDVFHIINDDNSLRMFINSKNHIYLEISNATLTPPGYQYISLSEDDAKSLEICLANLIIKMKENNEPKG